MFEHFFDRLKTVCSDLREAKIEGLTMYRNVIVHYRRE